MWLTSPASFGGMEKRFEIVRERHPIAVGSIAERIVGRAAIKHFAVDRRAKYDAEAGQVGVGG